MEHHESAVFEFFYVFSGFQHSCSDITLQYSIVICDPEMFFILVAAEDDGIQGVNARMKLSRYLTKTTLEHIHGR